jgi:hypothetical protein
MHQVGTQMQPIRLSASVVLWRSTAAINQIVLTNSMVLLMYQEQT